MSSPRSVVWVVAGCALLGYWLMPKVQRSPTSALVGKPAPEFSLPGLLSPDHAVDLEALRGQVVVLDFWASWCGPCRLQARILSDIAAAQRAPKVRVVGINTADDPSRAEAYARHEGLSYSSVLDTEGVARTYGALGLPTLVFVSPEGIVTEWVAGVMSASDVQAAIDKAQQAEGASTASGAQPDPT